MEPWELEVREAAHDLASRYATYADTGRVADLVALFSADCRFEAEGVVVLGRDALTEYLGEAKRRLAAETTTALIRHNVTTHRIDVEGPDTATGVVYYLAVTERGVDHWGRYRDRYVRNATTGRFEFAERSERMDGAAPGSWGGSTDPSGP